MVTNSQLLNMKKCEKSCKFLGASNSNEIIYGSGATHLINLIANSWGRKFLKPDDEIIITMQITTQI